ncbi:molybdopterin molybdotransferase MoeA [Alphaproteobacteria bacterium]|nr:molybdopterin molybdotransferase MoeA [Alphaproteobacteria bacterium]
MNKKPLYFRQILNFINRRSSVINKKEIINLQDAEDKILAENIYSKINLPPFKNSAVDGYALLKQDLNKMPKKINNIRVAAGDTTNHKIKRGEVVRIFTGAKMPSNSTTVVMQENTEIIDNKLFLIKIPVYGDNCRHEGEDISKGSLVLKKGTKIDTKNLNLIAAIGYSKIKVYVKIKIGFYTSGNELVEPTTKLKNSKINNSNYYLLNSLLNKNYITKFFLGNLPDNADKIKKKLLIEVSKYNMIITTGGASVGDEDHLIDTLKNNGEVFFWRAAIKPGRPIAIGKIKKTYIVCLPGNPVSVQLLYAFVVKPLIYRLIGSLINNIKPEKVATNFSMIKKTRRLEWLRVSKKLIKDKYVLLKHPKQGSGMITSISYSDGVVEIPEDVNLIKKGDIFDYYDFDKLFY